jgi:hypothetical protein
MSYLSIDAIRKLYEPRCLGKFLSSHNSIRTDFSELTFPIRMLSDDRRKEVVGLTWISEFNNSFRYRCLCRILLIFREIMA